MKWIIEKYHYLLGTHCWYCDRKFGEDKNIFVKCGKPLEKTKDHIIPKREGGENHVNNYIACCEDCNVLKASRNAKRFALFLERLIREKNKGEHNMYSLFPIMINRSWKLYNKTSKMHKIINSKKKIEKLLVLPLTL